MNGSKNGKSIHFTFYGETHSQSEPIIDSPKASLTLADTRVGDRLRIIKPQFNCKNKQVYRYLQNLGLDWQTKLTVISRTKSGSVIVANREKRIGLSAEISQQIFIVLNSK